MSSETNPCLYAALAAAQAALAVVGKSGNNTFDRYKYANLEDYVGAVKKPMADNGLSLAPVGMTVTPLADRTTKNGGTEHAVHVHMTMRLMHTSGEFIDCQSIGEGQDRADKAVYKAITGARKYALAGIFNLATSDDPEADENVGTAPPPAQRPTPAKPTPAPTTPAAPTGPSRKDALDLCGKWSGLTAEELPGVAKKIVKANALDKASGPEQMAAIVKFIKAKMQEGFEYQRWVDATKEAA